MLILPYRVDGPVDDHLAAIEPTTDGQREAKAALEAEARAALRTSGLEPE